MFSGPHLSKPMNPFIAGAFHLIGAVEIRGRGTNQVIDECRGYGIEPPTFEEKQEWVVVTFRAPIGPSSEEEMPEKSSEKILNLLLQNPSASARKIADSLGLTSRAVEKQISRLKIENRIHRVGPDKDGWWEVVKLACGPFLTNRLVSVRPRSGREN